LARFLKIKLKVNTLVIGHGFNAQVFGLRAAVGASGTTTVRKYHRIIIVINGRALELDTIWHGCQKLFGKCENFLVFF
jgi:hypothetical protein